MKILCLIISFYTFTQFALCREFSMGMFRPGDLLVAKETLFKEANPFGSTIASYGRLFHCPVIDRLDIMPEPKFTIVRGGLGQKYINLRIKSPYNTPVYVNINVACENKRLKRVPLKAIVKSKNYNKNNNATICF
ncbi:hypothetical protein HF086_017385 [Spodoptera exigua]|uniref:Uncharacterized protein n=1 Tax=Spodoptera exigua TaxID=7107 RepID=A0A922S8J6_SPOEX|nr:hypothetical protein HF086_017385 [Spodoptera exigua]